MGYNKKLKIKRFIFLEILRDNFQKIYIFFLEIKTLNIEINVIKTLSFFKKLCYNSKGDELKNI